MQATECAIKCILCYQTQATECAIKCRLTEFSTKCSYRMCHQTQPTECAIKRNLQNVPSNASKLPGFSGKLECFPEKPSWCWNEQVCQGSALSGPTDWILRYIKTIFTFLPNVPSNASYRMCYQIQATQCAIKCKLHNVLSNASYMMCYQMQAT